MNIVSVENCDSQGQYVSSSKVVETLCYDLFIFKSDEEKERFIKTVLGVVVTRSGRAG